MTSGVSLLLWAALLCALAYLPLANRAPGTGRTILKTLAVALLSLAAIISGAPRLLFAALAFCALGDLLLSRDGDRAFMAGVGSFAAGHLAYIALFLANPASDISRLGQSPWLWVVLMLVAVGVVMARLLAPRAGDLMVPVLVYIPIILGMGIAALTLPATGKLDLVLPAALAFIFSDIVLATEKFLLPEGHAAKKATPYLIWPFYWIAQAGFLIALH